MREGGIGDDIGCFLDFHELPFDLVIQRKVLLMVEAKFCPNDHCVNLTFQFYIVQYDKQLLSRKPRQTIYRRKRVRLPYIASEGRKRKVCDITQSPRSGDCELYASFISIPRRRGSMGSRLRYRSLSISP